MVVVSHNRAFLSACSSDLWVVEQGKHRWPCLTSALALAPPLRRGGVGDSKILKNHEYGGLECGGGRCWWRLVLGVGREGGISLFLFLHVSLHTVLSIDPPPLFLSCQTQLLAVALTTMLSPYRTALRLPRSSRLRRLSGTFRRVHLNSCAGRACGA